MVFKRTLVGLINFLRMSRIVLVFVTFGADSPSKGAQQLLRINDYRL